MNFKENDSFSAKKYNSEYEIEINNDRYEPRKINIFLICKNRNIKRTKIDFECDLITEYDKVIEKTKEVETIKIKKKLAKRMFADKSKEAEYKNEIEDKEEIKNKLIKKAKYLITKIYESEDNKTEEKINSAAAATAKK